MSFLPEADKDFLEEKQLDFREVQSNSHKGLILHNYSLPSGKYDRDAVDLLIVLPQGYPDTMPDMFYLFPEALLMPDKKYAKATNVKFDFENKSWQRWSRHLSAKSWRPGVDGLHTYLKRVEEALQVATP